jgi:hypothetical protein
MVLWNNDNNKITHENNPQTGVCTDMNIYNMTSYRQWNINHFNHARLFNATLSLRQNASPAIMLKGFCKGAERDETGTLG